MSANTTIVEGTSRGTLLVVDGHSLAFRAFFALPVENFSTSTGQATNAVWGFASMLSQVIDAEHPDHLAVAFDVKGGTFRSQMLPQYKGTRDAAPEELLTQLPLIQQMLSALGVTFIEKPGYEGDDVIGTLATMGDQAGYRTLVLSGDRDAFQLINDNITVLYPGHHFKDLKHMTAQAVEEKYHVTPEQYPDLAALRGETADNIPGVPGVGDGFAAKWINLYGGLDQIIEHADEIGGKKGEALRENIEQVKLNRSVNALVRDLDLDVRLDDLTFGQVNTNQLDELFSKLEFGVRTKNRVLKTFNAGKTGGTHAVQQAESVKLELPQTQTVNNAEDLYTWIETNIPSAQEHDHNACPASSANTQGEFVIGHSGDCARKVAQSWLLHAQGNAKPGKATLSSVMLAVHGKAVRIDSIDGPMAETLQRVLDSRHRSMTVHGYKEQSHLLGSVGIDFPEPLFDTKLAGYLVHPDFHAESLEQAAAHFLDLHIEGPSETVTQGMLDFDEPDASTEQKEDELPRDCAIIGMLAEYLSAQLDRREQYALLESIEMPVSRVLHGMEHVGAQVDMNRLAQMLEQLTAQAEHAQEIAWRYAGERVNLQSPKQLQKVLFEDMGLKPTKKTKSGSYSTNAAALQTLRDRSYGNDRACQFLDALLMHREHNKLKQIVQTLIDATDKRDGRIHTTFEQTVAATGRLSSVDPNLQNIPNRNAAGREIRSAFVPGEGFESLLSSDYSQVELRIMADLSGDEALIEAFRSGRDFHKYVASLVYGIPVDEITSDQRSHVKAMSYGLAYGLSTYGLAQQLKIKPSEAEALKRQYFATFGKVHEYLESLVSTAREKGYTETIYGRRRYFPGLNSPNRVIRESAERAALNAPIQGSAADIMKIAMIRAEEALRKTGMNSRIILQIHDELVVEIAPGESGRVSELVKDAMEHAVEMAVPLDVSTGIGSDWQLAAH
jgi:DNA polymerase I